MKALIQLPHNLSDNEGRYIALILAVIDYSNPESETSITYSRDKYHFNISPKNEDFRQDIINNLLGVHRNLKIKITFSSSLKISKLVQFTVKKDLEDNK